MKSVKFFPFFSVFFFPKFHFSVTFFLDFILMFKLHFGNQKAFEVCFMCSIILFSHVIQTYMTFFCGIDPKNV